GSGQNADAAAGAKERASSFHFHHGLAGENVEKLLRLFMVVADFAPAGRDELFDHAQASVFHQMPAVAIVSPAIMFRILAADQTWLRGIGILRHAFHPLFVTPRSSVSCVHEHSCEL